MRSTGHVMPVDTAFMEGALHVAALRRQAGADLGPVLASTTPLSGAERDGLLEELAWVRAQQARLAQRGREITERLERG